MLAGLIGVGWWYVGLSSQQDRCYYLWLEIETVEINTKRRPSAILSLIGYCTGARPTVSRGERDDAAAA